MSKKAIRLGEYLEKEAALAENMADACNALEETVSFFYQQGAHSAAGTIIPYEELLGIMFQPAPDNRAEVFRPAPPVVFGVCRFCGQAQSVGEHATQGEADEDAARRCRCIGAQSYREKLNAEARRAQALADAAELIENLFGTGAAEDAEPVNDEALEMLKAGAALVYDRQLVSQQLAVTYTIRAKIARNTKGNLTIERKDTSPSKLEV